MIDLHMHTLFSDGDKTVKEVLEQCQEKGLEYMSITDHNTCQAYETEEIKNIEKFYKGKLVTGIELTANYNKNVIEILGYKIDIDKMNQWCKSFYSHERVMEKVEVLYKRLIGILDKKGIYYNKENISLDKFETEFIERPIYNEIIQYKENKDKIEPLLLQSFSNFFRKALTNPTSEWFINHAQFNPSAEESIELIHSAGGIAFLAHPYQYGFENTTQIVEDIRSNTNLDGIECYYSKFTDTQMKHLEEYAIAKKLFRSGGSDYHGDKRADIKIGTGINNNLNISKEIIKEWI